MTAEVKTFVFSSSAVCKGVTIVCKLGPWGCRKEREGSTPAGALARTKRGGCELGVWGSCYGGGGHARRGKSKGQHRWCNRGSVNRVTASHLYNPGIWRYLLFFKHKMGMNDLATFPKHPHISLQRQHHFCSISIPLCMLSVYAFWHVYDTILILYSVLSIWW